MFISSILIFIGVAFFLKNSGLVPNLDWGVIWPLIIIWLGIYLAVWTHKISEGWSRGIARFFRKIN